DLEEFGRHLAVAIDLGEQVCMLLAALERLPEPVLIADQMHRLRYANQRACRYLPGTQAGWQRGERARSLSDLALMGQKGDVTEKSRPVLETPLQRGIDQVCHLEVTDGQNKFPVALYTTRLIDLAAQPIGVVGCALDLSYQYRIFEALRFLNKAEDTRSF